MFLFCIYFKYIFVDLQKRKMISWSLQLQPTCGNISSTKYNLFSSRFRETANFPSRWNCSRNIDDRQKINSEKYGGPWNPKTTWITWFHLMVVFVINIISFIILCSFYLFIINYSKLIILTIVIEFMIILMNKFINHYILYIQVLMCVSWIWRGFIIGWEWVTMI